MNSLWKLLKKYDVKELDVEISSVEWLTQKSSKQSILFYHFINKNDEDISKFLERIEKASYAICITNLDDNRKSSSNIYHFSDHKYEMIKKELLNNLYPLNLFKLRMIGVTGTNGKTTVVNLLQQLYLQQKKNILSIGTLGVSFNGKDVSVDKLITSLSYIDLHKLLHTYQSKAQLVVMEMTSHGLVQQRYGDLKFDAIAWTNFTQDHLDYHETMENYFEAKMRAFSHLKTNAKVLVPKSQIELIKNIKKEVMQVEFLDSIKNTFFKVKYNRDNLALALGLIHDIVNLAKVDIESLRPPAGRFNILNFKDSFVVIDYAHTPDGLASICSEIKNNFKSHKLITLFGCGGNRDKAKRKLMGEAASKYSDMIILTSDNPRFEDPSKIIDDIISGVSINYEKIEDRKHAIEYAFKIINHSVLLIAGKGHEDYIEINGKKKPYSDYETVMKYMKESDNVKS